MGADVDVTGVEVVEIEADGRVTKPDVLLAGGAAAGGVTVDVIATVVVDEDDCCVEEDTVVTCAALDVDVLTAVIEVLLDVVTTAVVLLDSPDPADP